MTSTLKPRLGFGLLLIAVALGGCAMAQAQRPVETPAIAGLAQEPLAHGDVAQERSAQGHSAKGGAIAQPSPKLALAQANSQASSQAEEAESLFAQAPLGRPNRPISAANITTVKVFNLDSQCEDFEGEVVTLAEDGSLEEAVGLAIANSNNPDFSISSYRVEDGRFPQEVVVDLRLAPDSERVFQSLAVCEGRALFGSIRRTLVDNGQFDVTQVQFTAAGEDIVL